MFHAKSAASSLAVLMLLSVLVTIVPTATGLDERHLHFVGTHEDQAFTDGSKSITWSVGASILPSVPVAYGHSLSEGSVHIELEGLQQSHTDTYTVASGALNGTLNETVNDGTSIELMSATSGPPQAGTNSSTVLSTTNLAGTHSYDTCLLYTSPSPRDVEESRMPSSA